MGARMTLLQVEEEIDWLADIVRREGCRSFLEIGSKYGESLRRIAAVMPPGSKIVSVDLPMGTREWARSRESLGGIIDGLRKDGYDAQVIWGDSTAQSVIEQVRKRAPFDFVFIDANHTLPYVTKDWETYGPMGRVVAFHDIAWRRAPEWSGTRIDVPQFWEQIKAGGYRTEEIKACPTGKNNGIGVVWRE